VLSGTCTFCLAKNGNFANIQPNGVVRHLNPSEKNVNRSLTILGIASLACAGALFAQSNAPKSGRRRNPQLAPRKIRRPSSADRRLSGKCSICHFDTSEAKKIGPGLKGLNKRGTFSVNGNKVTDENLKTWIENGDSLMPPFKELSKKRKSKTSSLT